MCRLNRASVAENLSAAQEEGKISLNFIFKNR
jgi:hypothetical protein